MTLPKTYITRPSNIQKNWYLIDAKDLILGRLASVIAVRLRGKHKPIYTPNIDCGDYLIVINADKIKLTGKKKSDKKYYWHTGYPGGIKSVTPEIIFEGKFPERVLMKAVQRMIPRGPLGKKVFSKLFVYSGNDHPHSAQQPKIIDVGLLNSKNKR